LRRLLEQSWPIQEHLKNENPTSLFSWIGQNLASVVRQGMETFSLSPSDELPIGVTFSFPMVQRSLSEATLMTMGKGFAITSELNLGAHLLNGYEQHRGPDLPRIRVTAIANDAVATLVSFIYQFPSSPTQKAAMGLIVGTGSNATIPLKLGSLHASKRPHAVSVLPGREEEEDANVKIAVNTEWSINGSAGPLRKFGLISHWDTELDAAGEKPGFQPLEYMTAGRYLGELGRLMYTDYLTSIAGVKAKSLPAKLRQRFGLSTTFLSHFRPHSLKGPMLEQLRAEFPLDEQAAFQWNQHLADVLHKIALAIELRAAGIIAAATVGLLKCAGDIPRKDTHISPAVTELVVGYTGGCISHFQDYLADCQIFMDDILHREFDGKPPLRVTLSPCHHGGITGAGILVPAALASARPVVGK
jgi:hexokinase